LVALRWADDERLAGWQVVPSHPFVVPLRLERADWALATALAGLPLDLTIEGAPTTRTLVFGDAAALVDCVEASK
jgi:hypothetical protein